MEVINKLYSLIQNDHSIEVFNNNQDLFQQFYYHNMSIRYGGKTDIERYKVIKIYEYLLSINIDEDHYTMPYINSKILDDINDYLQGFTQEFYYSGVKATDSKIDYIFQLIEEYYKIKNMNVKGELTKLIDENILIRDFTGAMIIILNSSFFNLSNDNILKMMDYVKNNKYLQSIIEKGKQGNDLLDRDYIFQYSTRFLYNSYFVSEEEFNNDLLLNAIKEGNITDKDTIKKLFKYISIDMIIMAFDYDLSKIIDVIENSFDDVTSMQLIQDIIDKLIEERYYQELFTFVMNDERCEKYINDSKHDIILCCYPFSYSELLTDEEVNYLLDNDSDNKVLLYNLQEAIQYNTWKDETIQRIHKMLIAEKIPNYHLNSENADLVIKKFLMTNDNINFFMLCDAYKRLIRNYTKDESTKVFIIFKKTGNLGTAITDKNMINLSVSDIFKLLKDRNIDDPNMCSMLDTVFHESRHLVQKLLLQQDDLDIDIYNQYKEEIIGNISKGYYEKNYIGVSYERDARIHGARGVVDYLKSNLNDCVSLLPKTIDYYEKLELEETKKFQKQKQLFELSDLITVDEVLDKILSINPDILKQYTLLSKEYNKDGTKKSDYIKK